MTTHKLVGKVAQITWETDSVTELKFGNKSVWHRTLGEESWKEVSAIISEIGSELYLTNWEDCMGNSFTQTIDLKAGTVSVTWTYEEGGVNSSPKHSTGKIKFIN